ncbi:MAG: aminomethyl-transferring glycine dehydrogenase subunit GcvPA [Planctomycetes bacterium]|nr:aminomethyl-transferring glycine dehydrogenase subunit GcvPA [Planctomycetota bacterium]
MPYIQNSDADRAAMLQTIGVDSIDALFEAIPDDLKVKGNLGLGEGLTETELRAHMTELGSWNRPASERPCFLGGGTYNHDWPALVDSLSGRSEFMTAYTPYQPECSQGTLQWIYEFQSMIAEVCGCEVANASMYDGATAAAEAALMAMSVTRKKRVVVSAGLHPHTRETLVTYLRHLDAEVIEAPLVGGLTDWGNSVNDDTAAVFVQQPNFLGHIEDLDALTAQCEGRKAMSVCSLYPIATGLLRSPGSAGVDIVVGDGQSFGVPMSFGGPHFGFFATRQKQVRKLPGRLVGISKDGQGRRAFTLTFQTREQHIRREKATSNICTNNALIALRGCIHMAALGPKGLEEVACLSRQRAVEMVEALTAATGSITLAYPDAAFFSEVAFRVTGGDEAVMRFRSMLSAEGIAGVLPMSEWYADLDGVFTLACTEKTTPDDIRRLAAVAGRTFKKEMAL